MRESAEHELLSTVPIANRTNLLARSTASLFKPVVIAISVAPHDRYMA